MTISLTLIILGLSFAINFILTWYIIQLLKRFLNFQQQLDEFIDKIGEYEDHIDTVYNMETFYGDPTLSKLLEHSRDISTECENFKIFYFDDVPEDLEDLDDEEKDINYGA